MKYFLPGFRTKNVLDVKITWTYVNEKYHFDIFLSNIIFVSYQWILCRYSIYSCVWWMKPFVYNPTLKVNKHYTYFPCVHISWWVFDNIESLERFPFANINRKGCFIWCMWPLKGLQIKLEKCKVCNSIIDKTDMVLCFCLRSKTSSGYRISCMFDRIGMYFGSVHILRCKLTFGILLVFTFEHVQSAKC